jgi:hypothetical protein
MKSMSTLKNIPSHTFLFLGIFVFVFIYPLMDVTTVFEFVGPLSYSIIILSILSIVGRNERKKSKALYYLVVLSILFIWLLYFIELPLIRYVSFVFNIIVFMMAFSRMIGQILASKEVTIKVVLEAINGYLLLGVMLTLSNVLLWQLNHDSFSNISSGMVDLTYFSFISITTIGYGDISPQTDIAKLVSVFFGLASQLYLTIIIALIIGKFLNNKNM